MITNQVDDTNESRRDWMMQTAARHARELTAMVEGVEPAVSADRRWLIALAVFVREVLPDHATPTTVGEAMAAVSVALHEALKP